MTTLELITNPDIEHYYKKSGKYYYAQYPTGELFEAHSCTHPILFKRRKILEDYLICNAKNLWQRYQNQIDDITTEDDFIKRYLQLVQIKEFH